VVGEKNEKKPAIGEVPKSGPLNVIKFWFDKSEVRYRADDEEDGRNLIIHGRPSRRLCTIEALNAVPLQYHLNAIAILGAPGFEPTVKFEANGKTSGWNDRGPLLNGGFVPIARKAVPFSSTDHGGQSLHAQSDIRRCASALHA
jgi:hypothetical protein